METAAGIILDDCEDELTLEKLKQATERELTSINNRQKNITQRLNKVIAILDNRHEPSNKISRILNSIEWTLRNGNKKELLVKELLKNKEFGLRTRGKRQRLTEHLKLDERFHVWNDKKRYLWISLK